MYDFTKYLFENLAMGNASVINMDNMHRLNSAATEIYSIKELNGKQIEILKYIVMSCNILYNRTDIETLPIDDGFYDLLMEKYKKYDENFQVGSAVVDFQSFKENDLENPQTVAIKPITFGEIPKRDEVHQDMYDNIMQRNMYKISDVDYHISPIEFESSYITKRTHDIEHNHPSLVGTLDKTQFIFVKDAIDAGCIDDPNVQVLERDFFQDHVQKGIYDPTRVINVVAELKYDGISVEADCGLELYSARTRGDTGIGAASDITPILKGYPFRRAGCMIGQKPVGVKFEAIITKTDLDKFNILRGKSYKNCRTAIVGLFGASDAYLYRDLITLIPLALDRDDMPQISNRMEEIQFLNEVFSTHGEPLRYCYMKGTIPEILYLIKAFWDEAKVARDYLNFMYDGIVISYLDEDIRNKLGRKNFINKYSIAVKFDPLEKQTIFRGYTFEVGQHGQVTPMIHYDSVEFLGTIHNKSSGSSLRRCRDLGLKYGDIINVTYRNDVMPYVSKVDCEHNRNNPNPVMEFKMVCPVCGSQLVESESGKSAICTNIECEGRSIARMTNMFSKLGIKGFADATFIALKKYHLYELMYLTEEWLITKLGDADGHAFRMALDKLMTEPINDYIIMGSLGFTSVAHLKWKAILNHITIKELYDMYLESYAYTDFRRKISRIIPNLDGTVTQDTIISEFSFYEKDIIEILSWGNIIDSKGKYNDNVFSIRFSGVRNKQLVEQLCNMGYDASDGSVSKSTDILIVPYDGFKSSKVKQVSSTCKIIQIDEFINNMNNYLPNQN